jgi:hypothetical protein
MLVRKVLTHKPPKPSNELLAIFRGCFEVLDNFDRMPSSVEGCVRNESRDMDGHPIPREL